MRYDSSIRRPGYPAVHRLLILDTRLRTGSVVLVFLPGYAECSAGTSAGKLDIISVYRGPSLPCESSAYSLSLKILVKGHLRLLIISAKNYINPASGIGEEFSTFSIYMKSYKENCPSPLVVMSFRKSSCTVTLQVLFKSGHW